jgi:hypothetical protein
VRTQPTWIDDHAGRNDVGVLFGGSSDPFQEEVALWENEFWNKHVKQVYALGAPEPVGFPETAVMAPRGRLIAGGTPPELQRTHYMLTATELALAGAPLAQQGPFTLYLLTPPPRIASNVTGLFADGWSGPDATYNDYAPKRAGRLRVVVSRAGWGGPDRPGRVTVTVSPAVVAAPKPFAIHAGKTRVVTVQTPTRPYTVQVHIEPTFSPAQFGRPDARQLGAVIHFMPLSR